MLLTAFFLNNLTGIGRSNYIHSTYVAHQTAKWCFDSSYDRTIDVDTYTLFTVLFVFSKM